MEGINNKKLLRILLLSGLVAVFILSVNVLADEIDKGRALEILQQFGGPGGCTDEQSCRDFCENPDNFQACLNWAREHGLIEEEEARKVEKLAKRDFQGPGGCRTPEECRNFCENPQNFDTCLDFSVSQGFLSQEEVERIKRFRTQAQREFEEADEEEFDVDPGFDKKRARQIIESQGGPGGCQTFEECAEFCDDSDNQEACFEFAEKHALFTNQEAVQKIRRVMREGGPGGCRGERECHEFCENPDNFEACINFAEEYEFVPKEKIERFKRGARALKEGGPGGCKTPRECREFCENPDNQEVCFEWAEKHDLISEEQSQMIEEFKQRREGLEREFELRKEEFEQRREEFRRPEGFTPPGELLGPGGCVGAEECRRFCEDPANKEVCEAFFKTPSGIQPPGFGGTPLPEGTPFPEFTPEFSPEFTPEFTPHPEFTPESPSFIEKTGGFILKAFRDFLR